MFKFYSIIFFLFLVPFLHLNAQTTGDVCSNPVVSNLCGSTSFSASVPSFKNDVTDWQAGAKTIKASGQDIYYQFNLPSNGHQPVSISALLAGDYGMASGFSNKIYFLWFEGSPCSTNPVQIDSANISGTSKLQDSLSFTHNVITAQSQYYLVIDFGQPDSYYKYSINLGYTDDEVSTPVCTVAPAPYKKTMTLDQSSCYTSASPYQLPLASLNDQLSLPNILFPRTLNQTTNYLPVNDDNGYGFILSLKNIDALDTETYHSFNSYPYTHAPSANYVNGSYAPSNYNVAITIFVKNNGGAEGLKGFRMQLPDAAQVDNNGFASPNGSFFYNTAGKWNIKYEADEHTITWLFVSPNGRGDNKTDTGYSCKVYTFDVAVLGLGDTIKAWYLPDNYGNDSLLCTVSGRSDCGGAGNGTYESANADWLPLTGNGGGAAITGETCGSGISCFAGIHLLYPCAYGNDNYIAAPHETCGYSFHSNYNDPTKPIITYDINGCSTEIDPYWWDEDASIAFAELTQINNTKTVTICKGDTYQLPMNGSFSGSAPAILVYVPIGGSPYDIVNPVAADGTINFNKDAYELLTYPQGTTTPDWPVYPFGSFTVPLTVAGSYAIIYGFYDDDTLYPYNANYYGFNLPCQTFTLLIDTPGITLNPATINLCSGHDTTIATNGAVSYAWVPSGSVISSNSSGAVVKPVVNSTYTVTGTDNNGCTSQAQTLVNVINCTPPPPPVAKFISPDTGCLAQCVTFIDSSTGNPTSWQWTFDGGTPSTYNGQSPPPVCYSTEGIYTVQLITSDTSGADTTIKTIEIKNCLGAVADFVSPDSICAGNACVQYYDNSLNSPTSWQWAFQGGFPSSYNGQTPPLVCYSLPGNYTVSLTVSNSNGGNDMKTKTIHVFDCALPVAGFIADDTACMAQCVIYDDTSSKNTELWKWTFEGGNPSTFTGQFPPQVCYSNAGLFKTQLVVINGYGSDTAVKTIFVKDCTMPVADFISTDTLCEQQCVTYTDASTGDPTSWKWIFNGGNPTFYNGQFPPEVCYYDAGHYTTRLTVTNSNGTSALTKTVIVRNCEPPTSVFNAPTNSCQQQCVTYTDASLGTPISWSWAFEGGTPSSFNGQTPPQVCYGATGIFQTTLITSNSNGSDTLVKFITVEDCSPKAGFASADTTCKTQCVIYTDSSTGNVTSWQWTFNGGNPSSSIRQFPSQVCYADTGLFQTQLIVTNNYGSDTIIKTIRVNDCSVPAASFIIAHDTICYGECISINNTTTGATDYHWTCIGGSTTFFHGAQPPLICYSDSGHFLVKLIASNSYGNDTSIIKLIVKNCLHPEATFLVGDTICNANCVTYKNASSSNCISWKWTFAGGKPSSFNGKNPPLVCYDSTGSYASTLIVSDGNETDTALKTIVVVDCNGTASFTINNSNICSGDCITITNTSAPGDTAWHWNFPGASPPLYTGLTPPQVCYSGPGNYIVQLTAYNQYGYATMQKPVKVTNCPPQAKFSVAPSSVCQGNCVHFSNLSSNNCTSWKWSFQGGNPSTFNGMTPPEICYPNGGEFDVTLIVTSITGSDTSSKKEYVTVQEAPDPHISQSRDTLICNTQSNYQWYYSNQIISGATGQYYVPHQNGKYSVRVAGNTDCVGIDSIQFISTGTGNFENDNDIVISPNPSDGLFQVTEKFQVSGFRFQVEDVEVFNMLGEKIDVRPKTQDTGPITIDLSLQAEGIYFIRMRTGNGTVMKKVEVIH